VFKGEYNEKIVAIKTVSPSNFSEENVTSLFEEIKVMCHLGANEYIVALVGASTLGIKDGKVFALCEFCPMGSLLSHVQRIRSGFVNLLQNDCVDIPAASDLTRQGLNVNDANCSSKDLILWSFQISKGMEYLKEKQASPLILHIVIARYMLRFHLGGAW
jgi:serine/threonine protein kinase